MFEMSVINLAGFPSHARGGCVCHRSDLFFAWTNLYNEKFETGFQLSCGAVVFLTFRKFGIWLRAKFEVNQIVWDIYIFHAVIRIIDNNNSIQSVTYFIY